MVIHLATHHTTLRSILLDNWLLLDWMEVSSAGNVLFIMKCALKPSCYTLL
jgi:hypothetical protein